MKQYPAKIFLAEKQAIREDENARTASVLGGVNGWFGNLYVVNDETLAPGFSLPIVTDDGITIILPVVGDLSIAGINGTEFLTCGEVLLIEGQPGSRLSVSNSYENELVNFIQVKVHSTKGPGKLARFAFDLDASNERLAEVVHRENLKVCVGKLKMRQEVEFHCTKKDTGVFCFVIQGSFEIEGRLLHHRDGLAIWNADEIEIESLGKESVLLLIEVPVGS